MLDLPAEPDEAEAEDADSVELPPGERFAEQWVQATAAAVGVDIAPTLPPDWRARNLAAIQDELDRPLLERIPLEDVKITGSTEDSVTILATLPEKLEAAMKKPPFGMSIYAPEPDRAAIAAQLKRAWEHPDRIPGRGGW